VWPYTSWRGRRPGRAGAIPAYRPIGPAGLRCLADSLVNQFRVFQDRVDLRPDGLAGSAVQAPEKTALAAGMAGDAAFLLDLEQHHVAVAIQADFVHHLHVPGFFPLAPQALARTRPIDGAPG